MVSINKWKNHFQNMSQKTLGTNDVFIVGSKKRGLGRHSFGNSIYTINPRGEYSTQKAVSEIVSPAAEAVAQAEQLVKNSSHASKGEKMKKMRAVNKKTSKRKVGKKGKKNKNKKSKGQKQKTKRIKSN